MSNTQSNFNQSTGGPEEKNIRLITVPKPFNLTKAKPKMIPLPEAVKREVVAAPLPKNMNKLSLADIEMKKKQRRLATASAIRREYEKNDK